VTTYRDDSESLRARVEDLERQLADAHAKIVRLEGGAVTQSVEARPGWFLGVSTTMALERELPFEVTDEGYEAIAELLKQRLPVSLQPMSQVGRTLTFRAGNLELKLSRVGAGRTRLELHADHRHHNVLLGAALAFAALLGVVPVAETVNAAALGGKALLIGFITVLVASWWLLRRLIGRGLVRQRSRLAAVFESVAELAAKHAELPRKGARIDMDDERSAEEETLAEEDHQASMRST
jgi:hypothetical protein